MGHLNVEKQTVFCHVMGDYIIVIMYFILNVKKKGNCWSTEKHQNPKEKKIIRAYVIKRAKNKKKERNNKEKSIESLN